MNDTECPRCGSPMKAGGVCPVCEIPHHADDGRAPAAVLARGSQPPGPPDAATSSVRQAETPAGRLWQSGRLALMVSIASYGLATFVPLLEVHNLGDPGPRVGVSPLAMALASGRYGHELRSATVVSLPAAAIALASFLLTRRTSPAMVASRPLLVVVVVLPALAALLQGLKLERHPEIQHGWALGVAFVALGAVAGVIGAVRFGAGVPAPRPRGRHVDDDDDE